MHNPDSAFAKESVKWESQTSALGIGGRPFVHWQFPMMLHKAGNLPQGGLTIVETRVVGHVIYKEDGVSRIPIGGSDDEPARLAAYAEGFRDTPQKAIAHFEAEQLEWAKLHAEREYEKTHGKLSARATAEAEAVEAIRGSVHLPTIPEGPRRKGRVASRDPLESAKRANNLER